MRRISLALALLGAVAGAGCSGGNNPSSSGSGRGVPGSTFTVAVRGDGYWFDPTSSTTVNRPQFGTVTSSPAGINCGPAATACSADFAWGTSVTLAAAGSTGYAFHAFAGACSGNADCALSGNADKDVVVRFATTGPGLGGHPNYSDAAIHGPEYAKFASGAAGALDCTACHGALLQGQGIALSCGACHAAPTPPGAAASSPTRAEGCGTCHEGQGAAHQAAYTRYTDASDLVIAITSLTSVDPDGDTTFLSTMTFTVTKDGVPFAGSVAALPQKTFYVTTYDAGKFNTTVSYGTPTATGTPGEFKVTSSKATNGATGTNVTDNLHFRPEDGPSVAFAYVTDTPMTFEAFTVFDNVAHDGQEFGAVDYVSAANDAGCQKCHGTPYMKHGYRVAATADLDDFAACKVCHYDTRNGGHQAWQWLVDDPLAYALANGAPSTALKAKYAYKASVMNDVHMSHAMEFAYPQTMANCVTCHEGKLNLILSDANFQLATCKSCHPIVGTGGTDAKRAPALSVIMNPPNSAYDHTGAGMDPDSLYTSYTGACNTCHRSGVGPPVFSAMHAGYNKLIYASETLKYSDAITGAITAASYNTTTKKLQFTFTATESQATPFDVTNIVPTALISMYGYNTKDFLVGAHEKTVPGDTVFRNLEWATNQIAGTYNCDTNGDHVIDGLDGPCPAYPRMSLVSSGAGSWTVEADLATWDNDFANTAVNYIGRGVVKRIEIGVMPTLTTVDHEVIALDMVTRTFDLATSTFVDAFYPAIVRVEGCNACHEALGTTFHEGDRGGSVVGCRLCHTTASGGSHLEMQSRSIDSYVHAIHSMQPFDIASIDFADPVEALHYNHHIESTYPNFTLLNCESCHNPGTYEAPTHVQSLPGVLSASKNTLIGTTRAISGVPGVVTGPAARACGSCHRAEMINEDLAAELAAFDAHTASFGYRETGTSRTVLEAVIAKVQEYIDYLLP